MPAGAMVSNMHFICKPFAAYSTSAKNPKQQFDRPVARSSMTCTQNVISRVDELCTECEVQVLPSVKHKAIEGQPAQAHAEHVSAPESYQSQKE